MITFDGINILNDDGSHNLEPEAEAVRLYQGLLPKPASFFIDWKGERVDIPAKRGIDLKLASFTECINYLADTRIKKSQSQISFIHRFLSNTFPTEYSQNKDKIDARFKLEYEMIQSKSKNDIAWLGEVGFSGMVRLDGTLTNPNTTSIKNRDGSIKIVRK